MHRQEVENNQSVKRIQISISFLLHTLSAASHRKEVTEMVASETDTEAERLSITLCVLVI